ncbi:MAG: LytR C-terminal domain-containing protein [Actinobacteria bacterium]|nr:LytR C-terminal domain-containing protein [Actinomycetota bacterium]
MNDFDDKSILSSGYRVAMRRAKRRARRLRNFIAFLSLAILASAVVWISLGGSFGSVARISEKAYAPVAKAASRVFKGVGGLIVGSNSGQPGKASGEVKKTSKADSNQKLSLLVMGIEEKNGKKSARGILVVKFDIKGEKIDGITIPGNTFVNVPGRGQEEISVACASGLDTLLSSVNNVIPIKPDGFLEVKYSVYERMIFNTEIESAFQKGKIIDIDPEKVRKLGKFASTVRKDEINLIPLPVRAITVGEEVFYEPDQPEIARLLKLIWGINQKIVKKPRVVVLNGNGTPGVGAKAAKLLVDAGFEIVETKNADNFNYAETKILIYGDGKEAEKIKKTLGFGTLVTQRIETGVADYAVVLGADYK